MKHAIKTLYLAACFSIVSFPEGASAAFTITETNDFSSRPSLPFVIPEPLGIGANTITGSLPIDNLVKLKIVITYVWITLMVSPLPHLLSIYQTS